VGGRNSARAAQGLDGRNSRGNKAKFENRLYIVTKKTFNGGQSFKFFAEEAGGIDYVSLNVYKTSERIYIKPCEQPVSKSQNFLQNADFSSVSK